MLSETMLVAWRRLDQVPDGQEATAWLYGVARYVLANQARSDRRRYRLSARLAEQVEMVVRDPTEGCAEREWVRSALAEMQEADREVLTLTMWEGLTPAEVAVALNVPAGTVRVRLHRARHRLRVLLERSGPERSGLAGHEDADGQRPLMAGEEGGR